MKRPRNFEKEDNYTQNKFVRGEKRFNRDINSGERTNHPKLLTPSSVKAVTPDEIRPELVALENKIDVNTFDRFKLNTLL